MKKLTALQAAWLLPITYSIHLLEEYFAGIGLPLWLSNLLGTNLSDSDFIIINSVAWVFMVVFATAYNLGHKNNMIMVALGTLVFVNGIVHLLLSVLTLTYSPGTISGVVLYIPLGRIIYKQILPLLSDQEKTLSIVSGVLILVLVSIIASRI